MKKRRIALVAAGAALLLAAAWYQFLRRIPDPPARHYWDEDRIVATAMKRDARGPQPKENCCELDGVLWDLVAIPEGARWEATMPPAVVFDGPVVRVTEKMDAALAKQAAP